MQSRFITEFMSSAFYKKTANKAEKKLIKQFSVSDNDFLGYLESLVKQQEHGNSFKLCQDAVNLYTKGFEKMFHLGYNTMSYIEIMALQAYLWNLATDYLDYLHMRAEVVELVDAEEDDDCECELEPQEDVSSDGAKSIWDKVCNERQEPECSYVDNLVGWLQFAEENHKQFNDNLDDTWAAWEAYNV